MDENKKIVYSESDDYFPKKTCKKYELGEFADDDTLEDCGGIKPFPLIDEAEKTKTVSEKKEAEIRRRLQGRAAEYLIFLDD